MSSDSESGAEDTYNVECILRAKGEGKGRMYLVKWEGFDSAADNTWEPAKNLHAELIKEFEAADHVDSDYSDPNDDEYEEEPAPRSAPKSKVAPAPAKPKVTPAPATKAVSKTKAATAPSDAPPAKKSKTAAAAEAKAAAAEVKAVTGKLAVLDRAQLQQVVGTLLSSGAVSASAVEAVMPAPDMEPLFKEGQRLANAIRRALPNSRWGSCTDHYGYKRCASANNACKKFICDHAKSFKAAKQWPASRDYAEGMLDIANGMVHFNCPDDNKARDAAIGALTALHEEAVSKCPKPLNAD
jgi:hypothetical protein